MSFPRNAANMNEIRRILSQLKGYGFTDLEIANALGSLNRNTIMRWRHAKADTYPKNQEHLALILDLLETVVAVFGPGTKNEYLRQYFFAGNSSLAGSSPERYLIQKGLSGREELMLSAKNFAGDLMRSKKKIGSFADSEYAAMHARLDIQILSKYRLDTSDIAGIINKDRRRVDALNSVQGRGSQPSRHEAHQLRQAAAAAILLGQHHSALVIKGLMTGSGKTYMTKWKHKVGSEESIVDIIGSQIEGDSRSYERAALNLGHILAKLTGKL